MDPCPTIRFLGHLRCSYETTASNPGSQADRRRYAEFMRTLFPKLIENDRPDLIFLGGE